MSRSAPTWTEVSAQEVPAQVRPEDACTAWQAPQGPPIDAFLHDLRDRVRTGSPTALQHDPRLAEELLLALTSTVENYFRGMLTRLMDACPISREISRTQMVSLLAARSYAIVDLGLAILDGGSLADAKEVKKKTTQLLGLQVPQNSDLDAALQEFDKVCHLRHAAVHSRGVIGSRSQAELNMRHAAGPMQLALDFALVQAVAAVCECVVRSYNRFAYRATLERWIGAGLITGDWKADGPHFRAVFDTCYSKLDGQRPDRPYTSYRLFLRETGLA